MDISTTGFQSEVYWGAISWAEFLKVGVLNVFFFNPMLLRGSWELGVSSGLFGAITGFMDRGHLSLSYWFWFGYFLLCPICKSCSAGFGVSFRGNYFVCSCKFIMSKGKVAFASLLCCHLGWPFSTFFFFNQLEFQEKREAVAMDYSSYDFLNNSWSITAGSLVALLVYSFSFLGAESDSSEVTCPKLTSSGRFSVPSTSLLFFVLQ